MESGTASRTGVTYLHKTLQAGMARGLAEPSKVTRIVLD